MKKQKRQHKQVQKQLPKHVSTSKKAVKVDGEQVFFPGFGFGVPFGGIGAGFGFTPFGLGLGFGGFGGFGYYGGWL